MKNDAGWIIIVVFVGLATFFAGAVAGADVGLRRGYIACLLDIQNNKPRRYVLEKQTNGETRWAENTEVEKRLNNYNIKQER